MKEIIQIDKKKFLKELDKALEATIVIDVNRVIRILDQATLPEQDKAKEECFHLRTIHQDDGIKCFDCGKKITEPTIHKWKEGEKEKVLEEMLEIVRKNKELEANALPEKLTVVYGNGDVAATINEIIENQNKILDYLAKEKE